MSKFDAREYLRNKRKGAEDEENKELQNSGETFNARDYLTKKSAASKVGFDTFSDDLNTFNSTLNSIYGGWQDANTMASKKTEVEGMYNRLLGYEDYRKKYGTEDFTDLSELATHYKGALDEWDSLAEMYGNYDSADAFNVAVKAQREAEEKRRKQEEEWKSADLDALGKEVTELEGILARAKEYDKNVYRYQVAKDSEGYTSAQSELKNFLASAGYSSIGDVEKAISDKKKFVRDAEPIQNEDKALKSEDFEKYSKIGAEVANPSYDDALQSNILGWKFGGKEIPNKAKFVEDNSLDMQASRDPESASSPISLYYLNMNEDEKKAYYYYLGLEQEGKAPKGTADEYFDNLLPRLKSRYEEGQLTQLDELAHGGFWAKTGASAMSVAYSLGGAVEHVADSIEYGKTGIMDDNFNARASSTIRSRVSQDVDWEIGNWDAFDFVYNTGMSMADSAAVMWMPGGTGAAVLGLSAAGQGVNDALDRGLSDKEAFWNGFMSGAFEMAFEDVSIGNFKALKDMPVDGWKTAFKNLGKTMLVNASEETLTELANIAYDTIAHGDLSQYEMRVQELLDSNPKMTEAEAKHKVALEFGGRVLESGASGAFMGLGFGTVENASAAHNTNVVGKNITANKNVSDVFETASVQLSPEEASAYEAYSNYAKKGVTAENAKARQVGTLALNLKADAEAALASKDSTPEERAKAEKILADLDAYTDSKSVSKYDREEVKALVRGGLEGDKNSEAYKLAKEYRAKLIAGKKISEAEITRLSDMIAKEELSSEASEAKAMLTELGETGDVEKLADIIARKESGELLTSAEQKMLEESEFGSRVAEEVTASEDELSEASVGLSEDEATLFRENYSGGDVENYRASFDLVSELARNNYGADYILENKGALTPRQVQNIYSRVVAEPRVEQQRKLDELVKNHEGQLVRKANIDDSIFNGAKGRKLWRNLNSRQKKAITFVKAFAKGAGINLKITYDGKYKGKAYNGYYDNATNTIVIDARAGFDKRYISEDAIIPTMSHELTHWMKQKSPELYAKLSKQIFDVFKAKGYTEYDLIATEKQKHPDMSDEDARDEIIARASEDLFKMSEEGKKIFDSLSEAEKKTLVGKIKELIQNLVDWVNELLGLYESKSDEARILRGYKEKLSEAAKLWDEMLASAVKVNAALEGELGKIDAERITSNELDVSYSLKYNGDIAEGQLEWLDKNKGHITEAELKDAQEVTRAMVDVMMRHSEILPEDKIGKVLTKNGSYDRSVENTTICVRTLAYNEFVDKVQEEIGRPLTQMESFLVSQKLYDIATEPQCLYCYVSLDRKAFNDMLLRYMTERDTVIAKYNNSDKSAESIKKLYEEFLHGRKDTKEMKSRFDKWLGYVDNGTQLLSLADIATEERQSDIKAKGGILAEQLADARKYAQSASWSKIQKNYVAYRDEILKLGDKVVKNLNEHYGLRWYSFSDYSAAFIVENMQQITDASIRGLKGLAYTKDTDFVEIFASTGMNINVSVFVNQDADGNFFIDEKQSANFEKAVELRKKYPNVGIVATVTNDDALRWAGEQEWSDVIIPFHIVRTGTDVAEYYKWLNYTGESGDTISDKNLWEAYVDSLNLSSENARKKVSKNIYPSEHKNNKDTYLSLCESRGLSPRFARFVGEAWYMKLVNETRLSADESSPLKPEYNLDAAKDSFKKFIDKGGYEGGWYKEGVDVEGEVKTVARDVLAGKKANEVDYGRQDGFVPEDLVASRKSNRTHGKASGVQFSEKSFDEQVEAILNGEDTTSTHLKISEHTPQLLLDLGLSDKPLLITSAHTKTALGNKVKNKNVHNISKPVFTTLPQLIERPAIVLESAKKGSIVMFVNAVDENNIPIVCSIKIDGKGYFNNVEVYSNVVTSVYGKDTNPIGFIEKAVNENRLLFWNKKMSQELFDIPGLQLPDNIYNLDSDTIIRKTRAKINDGIVNNEGIQKSEKDTGTSAYDIMGKQKELEKRYKILEKDFARLKEMYKLDKRLTHGKVLDPKQVEAVARYLVKYADSDYKASELAPMLNDLYVDIREIVMTNPDATWEELYSKAYEVAKEIRTRAKVKVERPAYYEKILKEIRSARIAPNEGQKGDAKHRFGDHYVGKFRGRVTIANDGTPLDIKWSKWASKYPSVFDKDIGDAQQLVELYDIYDDLRNAGDVVQEYEESEVLQSLATEIINKAWTVTKFESTADKQSKRIQELNAEHRKNMEELRRTSKKRETDARLGEMMHYGKVISDMRQKRTKAVADARAAGRERLAQYKENAEKKVIIQRITKNVNTLIDWYATNSRDKHIHESLKGPVKDLIFAIDFSSKQLLGLDGVPSSKKYTPSQSDISIEKALDRLRASIENFKGEADSIIDEMKESELPKKIADLLEKYQTSISNINTERYVLNVMTSEELKELADIVATVKSVVTKANEFHVAHRNANAVSKAKETMAQLESRAKTFEDNKKRFGQNMDILKNGTFWRNLNPYYAFKYMGEAAQGIFEAFMDGDDKFIRLSDDVEEFAKKTWDAKQMKAWQDKYFDFSMVQADGKTVRFSMNVPQIMSLYCVIKQEDARKHILHGNKDYKGKGITLAEAKKTNAVAKNITLTEAQLLEITKVLDDKAQVGNAKEVADAIQEYMGRIGSKLGNEITMARWGIKSFGVTNYFPITVSKDTTNGGGDVPNTKRTILIALLNASFTHSRNNYASNSVQIGDIFDIFSTHMSDMILYNSYALPLLDMYKWMNFKEVDGLSENSVRRSVENTFGEAGWEYLNKFLEDVGGTTKADPRENIGMKLFRKAKVAKVAAKLKVVVMQFTSFIRAGAVMDNKYLLHALRFNPKVKKAQENCGIARRKAKGYYDTNIARSLVENIKHDKSLYDKVLDVTLWGAGAADNVTMGILWNACELEIRDKRKDLKVGSPEFNEAVGKRLREVIYRTQVVDSLLTRSSNMRSKAGIVKMYTSFASEPTLSLNLALDTIVTTQLDARELGSIRASLKKNGKYVRKAATAYVVTAAVTALIEAVFAYLYDYEDDDRGEEFGWNFLNAFVKNLSITSKIPLIKEIWSMLEGFSTSNLSLSGTEQLVKLVKEILKIFDGDASMDRIIKLSLQAASDLTGIAAYNFIRDFKMIYHNLFGYDD